MPSICFVPAPTISSHANGAAMTRHLADCRTNPALRAALVASGLETIRTRHTCAHRVDELLAIVATIGVPAISEPTRNVA